ncbi:hypothetical protein D9M69_632520 [compost metagenome]
MIRRTNVPHGHSIHAEIPILPHDGPHDGLQALFAYPWRLQGPRCDRGDKQVDSCPQLIDKRFSLAGEQIVQMRRSFLEFVRQPGWVQKKRQDGGWAAIAGALRVHYPWIEQDHRVIVDLQRS